MSTSDLDIAFEHAVEIAASTTKKLGPDVLLFLYAYYKQATGNVGMVSMIGENDLRSAFKQNALFQVRGMTRKAAKKAYIECVRRHIDPTI